MKRILPLIILVLIISQSSYSQSGGTTGYQFLEQPISARIAALGSNVASIDDNDVNIGFVNPSLINPGMDNSMALNYINFFTGTNYSSLQYGKSFEKVGSFLGTLQYMDYGKIDYADENGNLAGTFGAYDMAFTIGWGRQLDSSFSIGAAAKVIYSSYESYNSFGMAVDVAGTYRTKSGMTMSLVARNMGLQMSTYYPGGSRDPLPFSLQYALSHRLEHVPIRFSFVYDHIEKWNLTVDDPLNPSNGFDPITGEPIYKEGLSKFGDQLLRHITLGAELYIGKNLILRGGYNYQRRQEMKIEDRMAMVGFSWGFGVRIYKFRINYSRVTYSLAGSPNYLTIAFDLNSFMKK
ncbi:MAG: type IX secretion system protein PorQ [Bacteroidales bacterium]|nr:type IX secretion system protein PorQ [Bacteroidales bacterium]MDG2080224.1 type IX secretion system protein PorQ [Bacteroidales bacterium]